MEANYRNLIARRLRKLRKQKGISQDALCGEEISRNMVSMIETGKCAPSLHSLHYLAAGLEVPMSYFFLQDEEIAVLAENESLPEAMRALQAGDYQTCLAICAGSTPPSPQARYLRAEAYYGYGYQCYLKGDIGESADVFHIVQRAREVHPRVADAADQMMERISKIVSVSTLPELYYGNPLLCDEGASLLAFVKACIRNQTLNGIPEAISALHIADANAKALALSMLYEARGQDADCRNAQNAVRDECLEPYAALYYYRAVQDCCVRMHDYETALRMTEKREALTVRLRSSLNYSQEKRTV